MKLLAVWTLGGLQAYHATLLTAIAGVLLAGSMGVRPQVSHLLTSLLIVLQQPHMQEDACEQMTLSPPSLQPPQQSLLLSAAAPLPDARSSAYSQSQPATYAWDLEGVLSDFAHLGRSWGAQGEEQKTSLPDFFAAVGTASRQEYWPEGSESMSDGSSDLKQLGYESGERNTAVHMHPWPLSSQ